MSDLSSRTTLVVGAGRGLGRGVAAGFARAGAPVVAVARSTGDLAALAEAEPGVVPVAADAADPAAAARLLAEHDPAVLVLAAGATPVMRPLPEHDWETFSVNWHADVRIVFEWLRAALLGPLRPGSRVIVVSSGAAVNGSPASGGYAGAKAAQRFVAGYAAEEARRSGLGISVTTVLPRMTPFGGVGLAGIRGYAALAGISEQEYTGRLGQLLTPEIAGEALVGLVRADPATLSAGYLLGGAGLEPLG